MKRDNFSVWTLLIALCCFVQCQREIAIDYSDFTPLLVVHAQISPDSTFTITVTTSASPISSQEGEVPEDASLTLIDLTEAREIGLLKEHFMFVSHTEYPVEGHTYRLYAEAPNLKPVTSEITVPVNVGVQSLEVLDYQEVPSEQDEKRKNITFDLEISFDSGPDTYLHLLFRQEYKLIVGTTGQPDIYKSEFPVEPQFPEEQGLVSHHEQGVLVNLDKIAPADNIRLSFVDFTLQAPGVQEVLGEISVEVRTVSREYYLFFESLSRQLISRQDPFAEPIPTFNNISDGLGNFSAYQTGTFRVPLR